MNNCLADLSRLIPADYMKKGRGRIEKTEIIEMAIKHMKHLQDHHATCHLGQTHVLQRQSFHIKTGGDCVKIMASAPTSLIYVSEGKIIIFK